MDLSLLRVVALAVATLLASTVAAVAGFGGAAILLPILVAIFGARDAIPILSVAQLIGNASRVVFNRHEIVLPVVGWFSLGAVPLALCGGILFAQAPLPILVRLIGVFLLLSVAQRRLRPEPVRPPSLQNFTLIGAVFSFLSALVGSVGPLLAPFFLAYGLVKGAYIGTEALATVIMHITKLVAYSGTALLSAQALIIGLALGFLMIGGSYIGKRVLEQLPERMFSVIIDVVLIITGLAFVVMG